MYINKTAKFTIQCTESIDTVSLKTLNSQQIFSSSHGKRSPGRISKKYIDQLVEYSLCGPNYSYNFQARCQI